MKNMHLINYDNKSDRDNNAAVNISSHAKFSTRLLVRWAVHLMFWGPESQ
jgi:hypothetical protein